MKNLEEIFEQLASQREPNNLYAPIYYTMSQGGKRLRPRLLVMSARFFGAEEEAALYPASAFEMLHNFTLIHDDIMDNAPIRRGKPTVYRKWDGNIAILSGDALATMAIQQILNTPAPPEVIIELTKLLAQTSIEICEGQQKDLDFETEDNVTIDDYIRMIRYKTAVLLAGCLKAGAVLAGASEHDQEAIYQFGIYVGLAFQLEDDLLDVYGDNAVFGKNVGGDIRENKKTYLYLRALQEAGESQRKELLHYFSSTHFEEKEKFEAVTAIYNQLKIKEKTEDLINEFVEKAREEIRKIKVGDDAAKQQFHDLAIELSTRKK